MIVWPIVVLALAVYRVKISLREMSHSYIDLESIQAIKGIFYFSFLPVTLLSMYRSPDL